MRRRKQFTQKTRSHPFFDRKVQLSGSSRLLSLSKVIPEGWTYVRIHYISRRGNIVKIQIEKLLGENNIAQTTSPNKAGQQDT